MRVGVIGLSEGNGHPFSFSAIVNGYDDDGFAKAGWPVIHDYLKERDPSEFGFDGVTVTHAWTQDVDQTKRLCEAAIIPNLVKEPQDMLGSVDAVLVARDDWHSHFELGKLFLESGVPVFIDKPLTLSLDELDYFERFLQEGRLMSCSGLRFAKELPTTLDVGDVRSISAAVVGDWQRYGIHLLDAVFAITTARPVSIARVPADHESFSIALSDGSVMTLCAIGSAVKTFCLTIVGDSGRRRIDIADNFSAFRSTLERFFDMCRGAGPVIDPADTVLGMKTLIAGLLAESGGPHVRIEGLKVTSNV